MLWPVFTVCGYCLPSGHMFCWVSHRISGERGLLKHKGIDSRQDKNKKNRNSAADGTSAFGSPHNNKVIVYSYSSCNNHSGFTLSALAKARSCMSVTGRVPFSILPIELAERVTPYFTSRALISSCVACGFSANRAARILPPTTFLVSNVITTLCVDYRRYYVV